MKPDELRTTWQVVVSPGVICPGVHEREEGRSGIKLMLSVSSSPTPREAVISTVSCTVIRGLESVKEPAVDPEGILKDDGAETCELSALMLTVRPDAGAGPLMFT